MSRLPRTRLNVDANNWTDADKWKVSRAIASRTYMWRVNYLGYDFEDAVQDARIGIWKGEQTFDPTKGRSLFTYCWSLGTWEILKSTRIMIGRTERRRRWYVGWIERDEEKPEMAMNHDDEDFNSYTSGLRYSRNVHSGAYAAQTYTEQSFELFEIIDLLVKVDNYHLKKYGKNLAGIPRLVKWALLDYQHTEICPGKPSNNSQVTVVYAIKKILEYLKEHSSLNQGQDGYSEEITRYNF